MTVPPAFARDSRPVTVACVLYPGITALDLVGPLQTFTELSRLQPRFQVVVVGADTTTVPTDSALGLRASHRFEEVDHPDVVVVPGGGPPTLRAMTDSTLLAYLTRTAETATVVSSVCTGALILGAAGLLEGRRATTHWMFHRLLAAFGAEPVHARWVEDRDVLTSAGVSAGIDMALHLTSRLAGQEVAGQVQRMLEYEPEPPQIGLPDWGGVDVAAARAGFRQTISETLDHAPALRDRLLSVSG